MRSAAEICVEIADLVLPRQLIEEQVEFIGLKSSHIRLHADAGGLDLREELLIFHSEVLRKLIDLELW